MIAPTESAIMPAAYFALGSNRGRVTHFDGREGDSDFAAYSVGGYSTHFGSTGWYIDTILQGTFYDINRTANRGLPAFKTQGQGIAASLRADIRSGLPAAEIHRTADATGVSEHQHQRHQ